jgi:hypothetical protein
METTHNPDIFMSALRQILSQGKKRIGFLVGAGAPLSVLIDENGNLDENGTALIPGVEALTERTIASLSGVGSEAAKQIASGLGADATVETVLSKIRLLEIALGNTPVHGLDGKGYKSLGDDLCKAIGDIVSVDLPQGRSAYTDLVSWISGTARAHSVEIFTTNYDLLFEEAFERAHAPFYDGFSGGKLPFFDPVTIAGDELPPRWSKLWKLHGSLGWKLEGESVVRSGGKEANQLVYPDHLKYDLTQKQPYSALFERLKQFLLTPDSLLIATGFSFRDAHIAAVVEEALAKNSNAAAIAFQYGKLADEQPVRKIAINRPNLSVYASDGAIVGGVPGAWRLGDLPKNWGEIRSTYWDAPSPAHDKCFLLGDFRRLMAFCALSQSTGLVRPTHEGDHDEEPEPHKAERPALVSEAVA